MRVASKVFDQIIEKARKAFRPFDTGSEGHYCIGGGALKSTDKGGLRARNSSEINSADVDWSAFDPIASTDPLFTWLDATATAARWGWDIVFGNSRPCGEWVNWLMSERHGPWGPALAYALIEFIEEKPRLKAPQVTVLLPLTLMLCVNDNPIESAERAACLHRLADSHRNEKPDLSRQLDAIAEFVLQRCL